MSLSIRKETSTPFLEFWLEGTVAGVTGPLELANISEITIHLYEATSKSKIEVTSKTQAGENGLKWNTAASGENKGLVTFEWTTAQTKPAGTWILEAVVKYTNGKVERFPGEGQAPTYTITEPEAL